MAILSMRLSDYPLRWIAIVFYPVALFLAGFLLYFNTPFIQDDAYITLHYAQNILNGHGPVWNPGERVEGYTNFLFLMLISALGFLGMEDLLLAAQLISFAAYAGIIVLLFRYFKAHLKDDKAQPYYARPAFVIPFCLALSNVSLIAWSYGALETVLFAFFVLAGCLCVMRTWEQKTRQSGWLLLASLLFALATMTRPDGMIFFLASFGFVAWHGWKSGKKEFFLRCFQLGLPLTLIVVAHLLWRHAYYGEWVPNTYIAKNYGIPQLKLLHTGSIYLSGVLLLAPFLLLFTTGLSLHALRRNYLPPQGRYLFALIGFFAAYILYIGGDFMFYARFFVPVFCLCFVLLFWEFRAVESISHKTTGVCALMLLFASLIQVCYYDKSAERYIEIDDAGNLTYKPTQLGFRKHPPDIGSITGEVVAGYARAQWKEGALIALNPAGALPYFAPGFRYIDMLGLMDKRIAWRKPDLRKEAMAPYQDCIAHLKGDGAYVLSRRPDYIILGMTSGVPEDTFLFLSDMEIARHPDFKKYYRKETAWVTVPSYLREHFLAHNGMGLKEKNKPFIFFNEKKGTLLFTYYKRIS